MKNFSPAAIVALEEALTAVYWYKRPFQTFLTSAISDQAVLSRVNWADTKRNIAAHVVAVLAADQQRHFDTLLRLVTAVSSIQDFSHLAHLEDGAELTRRAKAAVAALSKLVRPFADEVSEEVKAAERQRIADAAAAQARGVREAVGRLRGDFYEVVTAADPQRRGFLLERFLRGLFEVFDLDPKASFRVTGEQIDGAFTFDNTDYLLEAKWQQEPVGAEALYAFDGKVGRKLENTLGLFIAVNGFSADGLSAHGRGRPAIILMDGADLAGVLEQRIGLDDLILRKRRHAAQTGNVFLPVAQIMRGA